MCKNSMVIRNSVKELLAKNSVMWPMKYIVKNNMAKYAVLSKVLLEEKKEAFLYVLIIRFQAKK